MESLYRCANLEIARMSSHILYCNWIGPQDHRSVTTCGAVILDIINTYPFVKILNDNSQVVNHWYPATGWTAQEWFPAVRAAGIEHFAWITPHDTFAKMSVKRAMPDLNIVQAFNDYRTAHTWLIRP